MEDSVFVNKIIKGTTDGKVKWQPAKSNKLYNSYQPYFLQKGDKKLVIQKYDTVEYDGYWEDKRTNSMISICDDQFNSLSEIHEDDLKNSGDLMRLYRLVERRVNNVDEIMEDFVEGINDIEFKVEL